MLPKKVETPSKPPTKVGVNTVILVSGHYHQRRTMTEGPLKGAENGNPVLARMLGVGHLVNRKTAGNTF